MHHDRKREYWTPVSIGMSSITLTDSTTHKVISLLPSSSRLLSRLNRLLNPNRTVGNYLNYRILIKMIVWRINKILLSMPVMQNQTQQLCRIISLTILNWYRLTLIGMCYRLFNQVMSHPLSKIPLILLTVKVRLSISHNLWRFSRSRHLYRCNRKTQVNK